MEHKHNAGRHHNAKSLTSIFLAQDKRLSIAALLKSIKAQYRVYMDATKDERKVEGLICSNSQYKQAELRRFAEYVWNSLQNEFYHTADISWNSIWRFQDEFEGFDESGYLMVTMPEPLTEWTKLVKSWYNRNWAYEVLNFIKDWNLDNQDPEYVRVFQADFKKVKDEEQFISALYKWNDLVHWSPWKMSLLDTSFQMPQSVHYEDDFNPDVDSDAYLD
jgi:hypothetical protein